MYFGPMRKCNSTKVKCSMGEIIARAHGHWFWVCYALIVEGREKWKTEWYLRRDRE